MQEKTKENTYSKFGTGLTSAANMTLKLVGAGIFLALTWYAMRYTQYMLPVFYEEMPLNTVDSMWKNLLAAAVCTIGIAFLLKLEERLSEKIKHRLNAAAIIALSLWIALAGLWWITLTDRQPVGDQAFIYGGASYFMKGEYSFLDQGGYFDICPHQLGLTFLVELLLRVAGHENYLACQLVCVAMAVGIGIMGWLLIGRLTRYKMLSVCYCLLMFCCLPLIFYTGWVYGDVPSIFFMLLTAVSLLYYEDTGRRRWLALLFFSVVMAVLVRKNSLIMVIALLLSAGVYAIVKKDKKLFAALALAAVLPWLAYMGIYKMYEVRSGYEYRGAGIPAVSYLAMGMQEDGGKYGWYTLYGRMVYNQCGSDSRLAAEVSKQDLGERLNYFAQNPSYVWQFYREKVLSQWNQPLYQSMFFSAQYAEDKQPAPDSLETRLHGQYFSKILSFCDRMQFIMYLGILCYYLFAVKKKSDILQHMSAATIIGGFLFSIIWEAKARYILPYYIMMYPLAVVGYWQMLKAVMSLIGQNRRKAAAVQIPFRRAA